MNEMERQEVREAFERASCTVQAIVVWAIFGPFTCGVASGTLLTAIALRAGWLA